MSLTDFRETLRTRLESQMGFTFVPGNLHGPMEDQKRGCVFIMAGGKGDNGLEQDIRVGIRVFPQWREIEPYGPPISELEEIPDQVSAALKAIQTQPGAGFWFFSIQGFQIDYDEEWGTEVEVLLRREDPFLA